MVTRNRPWWASMRVFYFPDEILFLPSRAARGGGRSAHVRCSFTGKTTRELRHALQQLLRLWSREILDLQHLGSRQKAI